MSTFLLPLIFFFHIMLSSGARSVSAEKQAAVV